MLRMEFPVFVAFVLTLTLTVCLAQRKTYDERCQISEGNGVRVDECDSSKFLTCQNGRCQCPDPANQVYAYRNVLKRNKRSPGKGKGKGGGFKHVAAGAVAGVATYQVAKAVGSGVKSFTTTTRSPNNYQKVYSCYARVGGSCVLNSIHWEKIQETNTSSTTSAPSTTTTTTGLPTSSSSTTTTSSSSTTTVSSSGTSTTTTVATAQKLDDLTKMPKCIQNAYCKIASPGASSVNGTSSTTPGYTVKVDFDPRIGVCECQSGFKKNDRDFCVKA